MRPLLLVLVLLLVACGNEPSGPDAPPAPVDGLPVLLDGVEVARYVGPEPVALSTLLPEGRRDPADWVLLGASSSDGRNFASRNPARRYRGQSVRLYVDDEGRPSLGIFGTRARAAVGLHGPDAVEVHTKPPPPPAAPPKATIHVQVPGEGRASLSAEALAGLPLKTDPRGKTASWSLEELVRLRVGNRTITAIELVLDEQGTVTRIEGTELADPARAWLIKHNRRGELRIQEWLVDSGERHPARVIRGVEYLRVLVAP